MKPTPRALHAIACIGFLGLFALLMLWNTVLTPPSKIPTAVLLLVTVTPLLLPMRGFLRGDKKSSAWMAYISLMYFIHGCAEAYSSPTTRMLGLLEILLSLMLFFGAIFYIRFSKPLPPDGRTTPDRV